MSFHYNEALEGFASESTFPLESWGGILLKNKNLKDCNTEPAEERKNGDF